MLVINPQSSVDSQRQQVVKLTEVNIDKSCKQCLNLRMSREGLVSKYRNQLTVLSLGATMVASAPEAIAAGEIEQHPVAGQSAEIEGKWKPLPSDLKDLLKEVGQDQIGNKDVTKLINQPYKELIDFQLGKSRVRFIQVGEELAGGPLSRQNLEAMKRLFEIYDKFARTGAQINAPLTQFSVGLEMKYYAMNIKGKFEVSPVSLTKDRVIFVVPGRIDIGVNTTGNPAEFTDRISSKITTFLRPDVTGGQGIAVEACQSEIKLRLTKRNSHNLLSNSSDLNFLAQEMICNGIGQAVFRSRSSHPFSNYLNVIKGQPKTIPPSQPQPGHDTFAGTIPYIRDEATYRALRQSIPKDVGEHLVFSKVDLPSGVIRK